MIKVLIITVITISIAAAVLKFQNAIINSKSAYINVNEVYNEFEMTKEYVIKLDSLKKIRTYILDSMYFLIKKNGEKTGNNEDFKESQNSWNDYRNKVAFFEKSNQEIESNYKTQIIKQLNNYIQDFGKKGNWKMILGATNDGSIMYASSDYDITQEVIQFINQKYEGK